MVSLVNWRKDNRGSIAIQALFFVVIFLAVIYLGVAVSRVVSINQTVNAATYQAAKYIALNGLNWGISEHAWEREVWPLVVAALLNSPYISEDSIRLDPSSPNPEITVFGLNPECNMQTRCRKCDFSIKVQFEYDVFVPPRIGETSGSSLRLTFLPTVRGFKLECDARNRPWTPG